MTTSCTSSWESTLLPCRFVCLLLRHRHSLGRVVSGGAACVCLFTLDCRGSFGVVYRAVDKVTGEVVAVKVMDRTRIKPASIEREWTVLEHLGYNPYVVQFKAAYITRTEVTFVMEMCVRADAVLPLTDSVPPLTDSLPTAAQLLRAACSMYGGELFDRLIKRGAYSEEEARQPFRQVAEGLLYLHEYVVSLLLLLMPL